MSSNSGIEELSQQDLIGLIVHAYNNHLAAITGFNELALLHNDNATTEELLELSLKSCKDASYLGLSLLASISRLQLELEQVSIPEFVTKLRTLYPTISIELSCEDNCKISSHLEWLVDCFSEMIEFLDRLAIAQERRIETKVILKQNQKTNQIEVSLNSDHATLEKIHQLNLFNSYYSSKKIFGTAGIGLAKVRGFFNQTKASVEWLDKQGFLITMNYEL